jgi:bifunctional enzyme CysN/CysC/sulfate adenylyltransferase subunit 1
VRDALGARGEKAVVIDDVLIPDNALVAAVRALQLGGVVAVSSRAVPVEVLEEIGSFAEGGLVTGEGLDDDEVLRLAGVKG